MAKRILRLLTRLHFYAGLIFSCNYKVWHGGPNYILWELIHTYIQQILAVESKLMKMDEMKTNVEFLLSSTAFILPCIISLTRLLSI